MKHAKEILECKGIGLTPNRILVLEALLGEDHPVSLSDLEISMDTMDRSSIFRTLTLFLKYGVVHGIEDGSGSLKYEVCTGEGGCSIADMHVHFYCESCHSTFCLESVHVPTVRMPDGFEQHYVNYMIKGLCPDCSRREKGPHPIHG